MDAEVLKTEKNWNLGDFAVKGGPGRPRGLKNKFTQLKETLLDAFNSEPEALEALKRTLFQMRERTTDDGLGKEIKKCVDMEALRAIISVLPKEKEDDGEGRININIAVASLGKLSIEDLRAIAKISRNNDGDKQVSTKSFSDS